MIEVKTIGRAMMTAFTCSVALFMMACGDSGASANDPGQPSTSEPSPPPPLSAQRVVVEVDRMQGTPPLEVEQTVNGQLVSLANIFAPGGLDVEVRFDETDIPRQETVRLADLHALMSTHRGADDDDAVHVYVLVATADHDDEDTLGIMFDFGAQDENDVPREAFAVFASAHEGLPGSMTQELLLTSAHEAAHCFNLHHPDWEGTSFRTDSTIEGYSLTDSVRWALSQKSVAHLQTHDEPLVLPGGESFPFGLVSQTHLDLHEGQPAESFEVIDPTRTARVRRGPGFSKAQAVRSSLARSVAPLVALDEGPLRLTLWSHKPAFEVGEPVEFVVSLSNVSDASVEVLPLLEPEFGFLSISFRRSGEDEWSPFRPALRRNGRGRPARTLEAGGEIVAPARIFFGSDGWTFEDPGVWEVVADYPADIDGMTRVQSTPLTFEILEPQSEASRSARVILSEADGSGLGKEQGLYLLFQGGEHLTEGAAKIRQLVEQAPEAEQASAANLALARAALEPTTDPVRRQAPKADVDAAMRYLEEVDVKQVSPLSAAHVQAGVAAELEEEGRVEELEQFKAVTEEQIRAMELDPAQQRQLKRQVEDSAIEHRMRKHEEDGG